MNSLPLSLTIATDMVGSILIIIFSFLALHYARLLTRKQPENFLWGFLFSFCLTLAAFAISRAIGHLLKHILLFSGNQELWQTLAPVSGGLNTALMISLAAVTLYYHKGIEGYQAIKRKARSLKEAYDQLETAAEQLQEMNLHLEEMVAARTLALSASEKKFRNLFNNSKDMVYFSDATNQLLTMNSAGFEMLGYPVAGAPALHLLDIFKNEADLDNYYETLLVQGFVKDLEVELTKADGTGIPVLLSATAVYDDEGSFSGCDGIVKNLTRIKTMMAQLAASEKMASVGQIAAGVAHEINTPLGVILGYSQLMMDDFAPESEQGQNLAIIERQTKACRKIVADLLKFSRQSESARENISINEILQDVIAVTQHSLNMDHITVQQDFSQELPPIIGDTERLRQVFVNLINNAHHAMKKQGSGDLTLISRYDSETREVVATVQDSGHGIPSKILARIFDPFFTTKSVGQGTGLGLSVSYGIIQNHGGQIEVESPVIDRASQETIDGTAFHVRLPAVQVETISGHE
ncbi:MAG: PAS domain S-box protein [Desulfoarculaceae bacterium]|nr:PAS domain S-box protein [Desulfoarculaceae bacterium]